MLKILLQILPLFLIIGTGWIFTKLKIANQNWLKPIGDFALYIGFPTLIFGNLTANPIRFELIGMSFFRVSALLIGMLLLLVPFLRWITQSKKNKATIIICFLFGNAAFLGIPIINSLDTSLTSLASLNASMMLFWVFSLGLLIVEYYTLEEPRLGKILIGLIKNPLLLSVILGIVFNYLNIQVPQIIYRPIALIGNAVSPMVMLLIGIFIASNPPKKIKVIKAPFIFSAFKLLVFPLLGLLIFNFNEAQELSSIVQFAMPAAITPFAMAKRYRLDQEFICNSIIISTILSLFTLPLIIYFFNFRSSRLRSQATANKTAVYVNTKNWEVPRRVNR